MKLNQIKNGWWRIFFLLILAPASFLIVYFISYNPASAAIYITPGNSSVNATCTPSQNLYVIDGNVYYRDGSLTIEPGTIIKFTALKSTPIDTKAELKGFLFDSREIKGSDSIKIVP